MGGRIQIDRPTPFVTPRVSLAVVQPRGIEALVPAANEDHPAGDRVAVLRVDHVAHELYRLEDAFEIIHGVAAAHDEKRSAAELLRIVDRVRMPQIVLAVPVD